MSGHRVRAATRADRDFVLAMLVEAANAPHGTATVADVLGDPRAARYVTGWPVDTDISLIAESTSGVPSGAVWLRFFTAEAPAFGFVRAEVPELAIGVAPGHRGRGLGGLLMSAIVDTARARRVPAISLSVESDNPAVRLYTAHGFRTITANDHAQVMVLELGGRTYSGLT